jgi:sterol desaturase/sphingolipid hydroxylase (fatty acid hydroxylase superfamily)
MEQKEGVLMESERREAVPRTGETTEEAKHPFTEACLAYAALPWSARRKERKEEPAFLFFRKPWMERLVQASMWSPYLTISPVLLLLVWWSLQAPRPFVATVGWWAFGWLLWSFVEYVMHRFGFHFARRSQTAQVVGLILHGHHHQFPQDRRRLVATPFMHGSLTLAFWGIYSLLAGDAAIPLLAGTLGGYLLYEAIHAYAHHGKPRRAFGKALIRHHLRHHYQDDEAFFGISTPLWDYIFRTHQPSKNDVTDR